MRSGLLVVIVLFLSAACSPELNWREVRLDTASLGVLLPCKPDQGSRVVSFGGVDMLVVMQGCVAGGANFAVAHAQMSAGSRAADLLDLWKRATLANMRATRSHEYPLLLPGAVAIPQSVRVFASGQRSDGREVQGQAMYFTRGNQIFQAVVYADTLSPEVADTFFSGLKFQ